MRIVLASASPRRLELLRGLGVEPELLPVGIDETIPAGEPPVDAALRLARGKAAAAAGRLGGERAGAAVVIGADTIVSVDGEPLGKPRDDRESRAMIERLAGRSHEVYTGVALIALPSGREAFDVGTSEVVFEPLSPEEAAWYVATGEGRDKAGAYAVQGRAALFVRAIRGSFANVVGLPVDVLYRLARGLGFDLKKVGPGAGGEHAR